MNTHWGKTYDQILNYLKTLAICFLMGRFAGDAIRNNDKIIINI